MDTARNVKWLIWPYILGYDHYDPEEKKAMRKAEEEILGACGLQRVITEGRVEND